MVIKDLNNGEKRIHINMLDGSNAKSKHFVSDWFIDEERKNKKDQDSFTEKEYIAYRNIIIKNGLDINYIHNWAVETKRDSESFFISDHAYKRAKERLGWNKNTTRRMLEKVITNGIYGTEVKGTYKPFVMARKRNHEVENIILYGDTAFIFNKKILVTIIKAKKLNDNDEY